MIDVDFIRFTTERLKANGITKDKLIESMEKSLQICRSPDEKLAVKNHQEIVGIIEEVYSETP